MLNLVVGTKDFIIFDKIIAKWRLSKVTKLINKNATVLDFGCGNQGYLLKTVSDTISAGVGLDYDAPVGEFNNIKFSKFKFVYKLPFSDKYFDTVTMLAVLEHIDLDKIDILFKEFYRVLEDGGKIILTTPTPTSKPVLEILAYIKIINQDEILDHKKYYNKLDIQKVASNNGFSVVNYKLFQLGLNSVAILKKN